ncbi:MAG: BsuPI-related putative proteinase inhibitor [Acidobacteriota bacterium]|nr:BsuPI-related putative proteinase inhibitor [Acidobacteriota bacterium]
MARFSPIANAAAACGVLWGLWCFLAPWGVEPLARATPVSLPDETEVRQDLFLSPDYLPLRLGNRWIYDREDSRFQRTTQVKVEIIARPILKWTTYYVFNQLPFVPGLEGEQNVVVRYDQDTRRFLRLIAQDQDQEEIPLFPVGESADAILDQSPGEDGLPVANRLSYLTCPDCEASGLEMIFDRGLGILEVGVFSEWGSESYRLKSALVNGRHFGDPMQPETEAKPERPRSEVVISRADPVLSLEFQKKAQAVDLLLVVKNPTDYFLSFNFDSSQTYDFVVREKQTGFEVWRWSKGYFFTQVIRSHALLPQKEWKFKEVWNLKDNERNDIRLGSYEAVAILTSQIPRESSAVEIVLP